MLARFIRDWALLRIPNPESRISAFLRNTQHLLDGGHAAERLDQAVFVHRAHALFAGILDYFREYPTPGTYLANNPLPVAAPPIRHTIARGAISRRWYGRRPRLRWR